VRHFVKTELIKKTASLRVVTKSTTVNCRQQKNYHQFVENIQGMQAIKDYQFN